MGKLKKKVNYVIRELKKEGFTLQYYESVTTNSYYLKVDYGVCHTIRFSDHRGKKHLHYRYNVDHAVESSRWSKKDRFWQFYCNLNEVDQIIEEIVRTRDYKIMNFSEKGYRNLIKEYRDRNSNKSGFWKDSKLINKGIHYCN